MSSGGEVPGVAPSVGISWRVADGFGNHRLVADAARLSKAEPYGDCLTHHRGHHEVWEGSEDVYAGPSPALAVRDRQNSGCAGVTLRVAALVGWRSSTQQILEPTPQGSWLAPGHADLR